MPPLVKLLRPKEYSKNLFIFLPLFFAVRFNNLALVLDSLFAFILFSLAASAVYIFNDLQDLEADRHHPVKSRRPLAAGKITPALAKGVAGVLASGSLGLSWYWNVAVFTWIAIYLVMNVAYSLYLKRVALLDIFIIAFGFVIRLYVGRSATDTVLSHWIILMTFLLMLLVAFGKRRDDLLQVHPTEVRRAIGDYSLEFVNASMVCMAAVTVVCYILYTTSAEVVQKWGNLFPSTIFVMFGVLRFLQLAFVKKNTGSPSDLLLKDRPLQASLALFILYYGVVIYLHYRFNMVFQG